MASESYKEQIKRAKKLATEHRKAELAEEKRKKEIDRLKKRTELFKFQAEEREAKARRKRALVTIRKERPSHKVKKAARQFERDFNPYMRKKRRNIFDY